LQHVCVSMTTSPNNPRKQFLCNGAIYSSHFNHLTKMKSVETVHLSFK